MQVISGGALKMVGGLGEMNVSVGIVQRCEFYEAGCLWFSSPIPFGITPW